jgi:hypothetical protein
MGITSDLYTLFYTIIFSLPSFLYEWYYSDGGPEYLSLSLQVLLVFCILASTVWTTAYLARNARPEVKETAEILFASLVISFIVACNYSLGNMVFLGYKHMGILGIGVSLFMAYMGYSYTGT